MTKRILKSILLVAAVILIACFAVILGVLYGHYTEIQKEQLKEQTSLIAQAVENEGASYFDGLTSDNYRITLLDGTGAVLYDSDADPETLESHADREEFTEALEYGSGDSSRHSATLTERMFYHAERLSDGSVLRLAFTQNSVLALLLRMLPPVIIIIVIAIILSAFLASGLSRRIARPLNELNLDKPLENDVYDEISPLLTRIEKLYRRIEEQMRELTHKREEWNTVTSGMNEGIVLLSDKMSVISINKSAADLLGTSEAAVGEDFLSICRRTEIRELLDAANRGSKAEIVSEFMDRDYQLNVNPITVDGTTVGAALLIFEVTDKIKAEYMRREFTANVSHELKTPLHIISGTAEIMKNGIVKQEDMPAFIERIYTEAQRMATLVDDIIRLSQLDEGIGAAEKESVSLKKIAEEAAAHLLPAAEAMSVKLKVTGGEGMIYAAPLLIAELVYNLCDNAIKYNKAGGSVEIDISETEKATVLSVTDTGIGIPSEHRERIFERFYRVDKSHSKEVGGTGLGLSIVKHIAKQHDAKLSVTSAPNKGTCFRVEFQKETPQTL